MRLDCHIATKLEAPSHEISTCSDALTDGEGIPSYALPFDMALVSGWDTVADTFLPPEDVAARATRIRNTSKSVVHCTYVYIYTYS